MILILSFSLVIVSQFYKPHMQPSYSTFSKLLEIAILVTNSFTLLGSLANIIYNLLLL